MDSLTIQQPGFITTYGDGEYLIHFAPLPSGEWACEARKVIRLHGDKVVDVKKLGSATRPNRDEVIDAGKALIEADKAAPVDWDKYEIEPTHPLLVTINDIWTAVTGEKDTWQYPAEVARETIRLITDLRTANDQLKSTDTSTSRLADEIHVDY